MERFVNRDEDIEAPLERARAATMKKMKALGFPAIYGQGVNMVNRV